MANLPSFKDIAVHSSILPKRFSREVVSGVHEAGGDMDFLKKFSGQKVALHPNILPPMVVLKAEKAFFIVSEYHPFTLEK